MKKEIAKLQKHFKNTVEELLDTMYKNDSIPTEKKFYRTVNEDYDEIYLARNNDVMFEYSISDKDNWSCSVSKEKDTSIASFIITYRHGEFHASVPATVFLDVELNKKTKALALMNQVVYGIILDTNMRQLNYSKSELEKINIFLGDEQSKSSQNEH